MGGGGGAPARVVGVPGGQPRPKMSSTKTLRVFTGALEGATPATAAGFVQSDVRHVVEQLAVMQRAYSDPRRRVHGGWWDRRVAAVATDAPALAGVRHLQPGRSVKLAIPFVNAAAAGGAQHLTGADTLVVTDFSGAEVLRAGVDALLREGVRHTLSSSSTRFVAELEVSGVLGKELDSSLGYRSAQELCLGMGLETPEYREGWVLLRVDAPAPPRFGLHHPDCAPHFPFGVFCVKQKGAEELTAASSTQLQSSGGRKRSLLLHAHAFFDAGAGGKPLTLLGAEWATAVFGGPVGLQHVVPPPPAAPGMEDTSQVRFAPFSRSLGEDGELGYVGVVFAAAMKGHEQLHTLLAGQDDCGGLAVSDRSAGEDLSGEHRANGRLFFRVELHAAMVARQLEAALQGASAAGLPLPEALERCADLFRREDPRAALRQAAGLFGSEEGARGLYLWWYARSGKTAVPLVSNHEQLRSTASPADNEAVDDWELLAVGGGNTAAAQAQLEHYEKHRGLYAESVHEAAEVLVRELTGGAAARHVALADRRYPWDCLRREMVTSMFLTHTFQETMRVSYKVPAGRSRELGPSIGRALQRLFTRLILTPSTTVAYPTKRVTYPYYHGDSCKEERGAQKCTFLASFLQDSGDAARVWAMLHILTMEGVRVYVAPKSFPPLGSYLAGIKYGELDPRCVPSWEAGAYAAAMGAALDVRRKEQALLNEKGAKGERPVVISQAAVGTYRDPAQMDMKARAVIRERQWFRVQNLEEVDFMFQFVGTHALPEEEVATAKRGLYERKLELLYAALKEQAPALRALAGGRGKDLLSNELYGRASLEFRKLVHKTVETTQRLNPSENELFVSAAVKGRLDSLLGGDRQTAQVVESALKVSGKLRGRPPPVPSSRGGTTMRGILNLLWNAQVARQSGGPTDEEADAAQRLEREARYAAILAAHTAESGISTVDRLWALEYERTFEEGRERPFVQGIAERAQEAAVSRDSRELLAAALKHSAALNAPGAERHRERLLAGGVAVLRGLVDHTREDFLFRVQHWTTSPDFRAEMVPDEREWRGIQSAEEFYRWCAQREVKTSEPCLAAFDFRRPGAEAAAMDTLYCVLHGSMGDSVGAIEIEDGYWQQTASRGVPLMQFVGNSLARARLCQLDAEPGMSGEPEQYLEFGRRCCAGIARLLQKDPKAPQNRAMLQNLAEIGLLALLPAERQALAKDLLQRRERALRGAEEALRAAEALLTEEQLALLADYGHSAKAALHAALQAARDESAAALAALPSEASGAPLPPDLLRRRDAAQEALERAEYALQRHNKQLADLKLLARRRKELMDAARRGIAAVELAYGPPTEAAVYESPKWREALLERAQSRPEALDPQHFAEGVLQRVGDHLDRVLYVAMYRTQQYHARPPAAELAAARAANGTPAGSTSESGGDLSSELGVSSAGGAESAPRPAPGPSPDRTQMREVPQHRPDLQAAYYLPLRPNAATLPHFGRFYGRAA